MKTLGIVHQLYLNLPFDLTALPLITIPPDEIPQVQDDLSQSY